MTRRHPVPFWPTRQISSFPFMFPSDLWSLPTLKEDWTQSPLALVSYPRKRHLAMGCCCQRNSAKLHSLPELLPVNKMSRTRQQPKWFDLEAVKYSSENRGHSWFHSFRTPFSKVRHTCSTGKLILPKSRSDQQIQVKWQSLRSDFSVPLRTFVSLEPLDSNILGRWQSPSRKLSCLFLSFVSPCLR